jgi:hypothetical protein
MLISIKDWNSRSAIAARIAERRLPLNSNDLATPGDYHAPFCKADAQVKASNWLWQTYVI